MLIHIGIDTVNLAGEPFNCFVTQGQTVQKGDCLLEADLTAIEQAGYQTITPIIITNSTVYHSVEQVKTGTVTVEDVIIKIN